MADGKKIITHPYFPMLVLLVVNIYLGASTVANYGESWDEANNKVYGQQSIGAYAWWGDREIELDDYLGPTDQRFRGPAYPMLATLFVSFMQALNPNWLAIDLWHFASFLLFQVGVFFFYILCLRYVKGWAAFGATLLFATQPLLWGHAFINSKDIPLMVFFLGSIALGLKMVDGFVATDKPIPQVERSEGSANRGNLFSSIRQDWRRANSLQRNSLILLGGILLLILLLSNWLWNLIIGIITESYSAPLNSFLGTLFSSVAKNAANVPLENYLNRGTMLFERVETFGIMLSLALTMLLLYSIFRNTLATVWQRIGSLWPQGLSKWLYLVIASVLLGLAVSTRVGAGLAAVLIALHFLIKGKIRVILPLMAYAALSMFVAYITWPYLWPDPIGNFITSLAVSSDFAWTGSVLFQGIRYPSYDLPLSYLPTLLSLQFTEPIVILFGIGVIVGSFKALRQDGRRGELLTILAWFFLPFLLVLILSPVMYDNFRHWLFIVPPIFIFAGFALDNLFERIRPRMAKLIVLIVLLLPGLYWGVNLHPYQYVYFNNFVGGVNGAFRQFELDYWVTSYREATLYLNEEAPLNSQVIVDGPRRIFNTYARGDLQRDWFRINQLEETTDPVYVIITSRRDYDILHFPDAEVVYSVIRDGAVLSVVKQIQ